MIIFNFHLFYRKYSGTMIVVTSSKGLIIYSLKNQPIIWNRFRQGSTEHGEIVNSYIPI